MGKMGGWKLSPTVEGHVPPNLDAPSFGRKGRDRQAIEPPKGQEPLAERIMALNFIAVFAHTLWFRKSALRLNKNPGKDLGT